MITLNVRVAEKKRQNFLYLSFEPFSPSTTGRNSVTTISQTFQMAQSIEAFLLQFVLYVVMADDG